MDHLREAGPWLFSGLVAIIGGWFTYRGTRGQTNVAGFDKLVQSYDKRLGDVEDQLAAVRGNVRVHRQWDDQLYDQARQAGWDVTPPPPLD